MIETKMHPKHEIGIAHFILGRMQNKIGNLSSSSAERWTRRAIILLIVYAILRAIVAAHARPLWFDEIFTLALARQPTVGAIWGAILKGVDTQGLLFDLVQRAFVWIPNLEIGFRISSIFAFACSMLSVYLFVERRSGRHYGLIAAASLMLTAMYIPTRAVPCAIDARGYSVSVACIAIALTAYQHAPALRWIAVLAIALAFAVGFNYYAVFALVPFAAAEAVYSLQSTRFRWQVWAGISIGTLPLILSLPHVAALKRTLAEGYFAQPGLAAARDTYGHFLSVSYPWGLAVFIACAAGLLLTCATETEAQSSIALRDLLCLNTLRGKTREQLAGSFIHERTLALFLLLTPFTVLVAARITHGAYFYHYMLYSILGIALAAGFILPILGRRALIVVATFLVGALAVQEVSFWYSSRAWHFQSPLTEMGSALQTSGAPDLPVFIEAPHDYLPAALYASPEMRNRLVFIADGPSSLRYGGFDTDDVELELLSQYMPLSVTNFQSFTAANKSFLMYSAMPNPHDWWLRRLADDGFKVQYKSFEPLASDQNGVVFLVTSP